MSSWRHAVERLAEWDIPRVEAFDHQVVLELLFKSRLDVPLSSLWARLVDVLQINLRVLIESQSTRQAFVPHIADAMIGEGYWADLLI